MSIDVKGVLDELNSIEERREAILKGNRDILMSCRKAIVSIHQQKLGDASKYIKEAENKLSELRSKARDDLYYYLINTETELVEARSLFAIANKEALPTFTTLNVKGASYILGLLDCIGELKRMTLDLIRYDKYEEALKIFDIMQNIYSSTMQFAIYDNIVQGVRRKLDQNRILIESVREVITEESRRRIFLDKLK
jgi:translin